MQQNDKITELENSPASEIVQEKLIDEINEENLKSNTIRYIIIGLGVFLVSAFGLSYYISINNPSTFNSGVAVVQNIFNVSQRALGAGHFPCFGVICLNGWHPPVQGQTKTSTQQSIRDDFAGHAPWFA